jgi:hypothetical protein
VAHASAAATLSPTSLVAERLSAREGVDAATGASSAVANANASSRPTAASLCRRRSPARQQPGQVACAHITMAEAARWGVNRTRSGLAPRGRSRRQTRLTALFRLSDCISPKRPKTTLSRGALVPVLGLGERSGERDDGLLMLWGPKVQVVAGEIQEHLLLG